MTKTSVDIPLTLPRLTGRGALTTVVRRARQRGLHTVVVLDEIDRATIHVAQSAMTLVRRSLDIPGLVVVLVYVDDIIRYKVFNPLLPALPDLESTMHAGIYSYGPDGSNNYTPGGRLNMISDDSLLQWVAWKAAEARMAGSAGAQSPGTSETSSEVMLRVLPDALRAAYAAASPARRQEMQHRFAEKYLGTHPITLHSPSDEDIALIPGQVPALHAQVKRLCGDSVDFGQIKSEIESRLGHLRAVEWLTYASPPIRAFVGELARRLAAVELAGSQSRMSEALVADFALAAYDAAGLQTWGRKL